MKYTRSEEVLKFVKQKKDVVVIVAFGVAFLILTVLSFSYLKEQKQNDAKKAFAEALLLVSSGNQDAAAEILRSVAYDYKGTVYATYSLLLVGQTLLDRGEYREAAVIFDEAARSKQSAAFLTAQIYGSKAVALEYDDSFDEALAAYKKALSVPNNYFRRNEYLLKSALLYAKIGQNDEAKKLFKEILEDSDAGERYLRIAKNEIAALENE